MEFGILLGLDGVMNLIVILPRPFSNQGREPCLYDFVQYFFFKLALACVQTLTDRYPSNLVWWYRPLTSTFWSQIWWPWPSFKVTVVWEIKNLGVRVFFSHKFKYQIKCCYFPGDGVHGVRWGRQGERAVHPGRASRCCDPHGTKVGHCVYVMKVGHCRCMEGLCRLAM